MPEDIKNAIRENAAGPKRAQGDSSSFEQHDLKDQIEADKYLASKDALKSRTRGLRLTKLVPPGSV